MSPTFVVQLYPTHPFRNPRQVSALVHKLEEGDNLVKTARPIDAEQRGLFLMEKDNRLVPVVFGNAGGSSRKCAYFRSYGTFIGYDITGLNTYGIYIHPMTDPVSLIDIDTHTDFLFAEEVIKENLFDFNLQ